MKTFLGFQSGSDDDDRTMRENVPQQSGQIWLSGWADAGARHTSSLLQTPSQGLYAWSLRDGGKKRIWLRPCRISGQARSKSHDRRVCVKWFGSLSAAHAPSDLME